MHAFSVARRQVGAALVAVLFQPVIWPLVAQDSAAPIPSAPVRINPVRRGFQFGFDRLTYGALTSDAITGGRLVGGFGLGIRFGWGFNEQLALVMDASMTNLAVADTAKYSLNHGDFLLRWTPQLFPVGRGALAPFLHLGLGFRDVDAEAPSSTHAETYVFQGEVLTLGAGTNYYISNRLALFGAFYWSAGDFNDERTGNVTTHNRGEPGRSARTQLGATFFTGRNR